MNRRTRLLLIGSQSTPLSRLLSKFSAPGDDASIERVSGVDNFYQHIGSSRYYHLSMTGGDEIGEAYLRRSDISIERIMGYYQRQDDEMALSAGWTIGGTGTATTSTYAFSNTAGAYIDISCSAEWLGFLTGGNNPDAAGVISVSIDGDNTRANLLDTAQDLVTAGTLPDTVLVANGGTLNPTDRVKNMYNVLGTVWLAKDLDLSNHNIRITITGYKQAEATGAWFFIYCAFAFRSTLKTTEKHTWAREVSITVSGTGDDISYNFTPTGATNPAWLGHAGQGIIKVPPVYTVDGVVIDPTSSPVFSGSNISIYTVNSIVHPEIDAGATEVGVYETTHALNSSTGFTVSHKITWGTNGSAGGYPCMMSANTVNRCKSLDTGVIHLTDNNGSVKCNSSLNATTAWVSGGNFGILLYVPDLAKTVNNWADNNSYRFWWLDNPTWKKVYVTRYSPAKNYTAGDILYSEANYRGAYFEGGADAALS